MALNWEDGFAAEKVRFHDFANIGWLLVDDGGCEIGGGGEHDEGMYSGRWTPLAKALECVDCGRPNNIRPRTLTLLTWMEFRSTIESGIEGKRTRKALGRFHEDPKEVSLERVGIFGVAGLIFS